MLKDDGLNVNPSFAAVTAKLPLGVVSKKRKLPFASVFVATKFEPLRTTLTPESALPPASTTRPEIR